MRFLRLARVKAPFRPSAPDPIEFCKDAIQTWMKDPSLFSVESHFAMVEWLTSEKNREEILFQSLKSEQALKLYEYLNSHPAPSLQALSANLSQMQIATLEKAA